MMLIKQERFCALFIVAFLVLFVGIVSWPSNTVAKENLKGDLSIAVWGDIAENPKHASYGFHILLQDWAKANPGVNLKYQINPGSTVDDRRTWIRNRMMAKALPDVVMIYWGNEDTRDPKFMVDFTPYLNKPNPYSNNPTWRDDFPAKATLLEEYRLSSGEYTVVGPTQSGDASVTCIIYNKTIFDKVGIKKLPETWSQFIEVQKKLKDAGYTPFFHPTAGPTSWLLQWPSGIFMDDLLDEIIRKADHKIDASDAGEPNGKMSLKEMCWAFKTGLFKMTDPRHAEVWRIIKDWSVYWQKGFMAPPPPGDPFLRQEVVMQHHMNLWNPRYENNPEVKFEWGTFAFPILDKETSKYANGIVSCMGSGGKAASASQLVMIPKATQEKGNFNAALDLCQFVTAPKNVDKWCESQPFPCFNPGTSIKEIFPNDPQKQTQYFGFLQRGCTDHGIRLFFMSTISSDTWTQTYKVAQEYLGDTVSLDKAMTNMQDVVMQSVERIIRQRPEWNADKW